jgi:threonine aldolase
MIDLRSDTVTKPTPKMREVMAHAEVGDDVYGEDPTVNSLQEKAAELFGREAALFVPSGTMGNQIAIAVHTSPSDEVILEESSHIYNYELATMASFSGVQARPIPTERGVLPLEEVKEAIRPKSYHLSKTGLICLENTHNRKGGAIYPLREARELIEFAHDQNIPVHLDGARIFNAAVATTRSVKELSWGFDSVMFCLSKGLGAPIGSMLVGSLKFIEEARRVRKRLGGGMRQVGILAAAGLYAVENHVERLKEDHENAKLLAEKLEGIKGIKLEYPPQTNILIIRLEVNAYEFVDSLKERGVLAGAFTDKNVRLVTHLDVSRGDVLKAAEAIQEVMEEF